MKSWNVRWQYLLMVGAVSSKRHIAKESSSAPCIAANTSDGRNTSLSSAVDGRHPEVWFYTSVLYRPGARKHGCSKLRTILQ